MPSDPATGDGGLDALLDGAWGVEQRGPVPDAWLRCLRPLTLSLLPLHTHTDALADFDAPLRPPAASAPAAPPSTSARAPPASRPFDPLGRGRGRRPTSGGRSAFNYAAAAMGGGSGAAPASGAGPRLPPRAAPAPTPDATLAALADQLAAAVSGGGGGGDDSPDALVARLEATLASLSAASAEAAGDADADADAPDADPALAGLASGLLHAMLAKDVMAAPMREIADKYPPWLAANRSSLPPADLDRYQRQAAIVTRVVAHYEDAAPNMDALFSLLQEMQACGAPPQAIVDELAPGLAFDEDGTPTLGGVGDACCVM